MGVTLLLAGDAVTPEFRRIFKRSRTLSRDPETRCRLILSLPADTKHDPMLGDIVSAGDVACVLISAHELDDQALLARCKQVVPLLQQHDVAAIIVDNTQVMGRAGADGILINSGLADLKDALARFSPQKMVGCGHIRGRHQALEAGECDPDFIFLGALDRDIKPEPHRKNLDLAEWWAQMVEIPCAVMGGNSVSCIKDVAMTGAEFVVLSRAVFEADQNPADLVKEANELLDEFSPEFEDDQI